eukprot:jgi/Bigna1/76154/fgenesh1_pg.39_\
MSGKRLRVCVWALMKAGSLQAWDVDDLAAEPPEVAGDDSSAPVKRRKDDLPGRLIAGGITGRRLRVCFELERAARPCLLRDLPSSHRVAERGARALLQIALRHDETYRADANGAPKAVLGAGVLLDSHPEAPIDLISRCTVPFAPSPQKLMVFTSWSVFVSGQTLGSLAHVLLGSPVASELQSLKLEKGISTRWNAEPTGALKCDLKPPEKKLHPKLFFVPKERRYLQMHNAVVSPFLPHSGKHGFFFRRLESETQSFLFLNAHSNDNHPNYREDPSCMEAVYTGMKNPAPLESAKDGLYDLVIVASSPEQREQAVRQVERKLKVFDYAMQKYTGSLEQIIEGLEEREAAEEERKRKQREEEEEEAAAARGKEAAAAKDACDDAAAVGDVNPEDEQNNNKKKEEEDGDSKSSAEEEEEGGEEEVSDGKDGGGGGNKEGGDGIVWKQIS